MKYTKESFIEAANKVHNNYYDYSKIDFVDCQSKILIICPVHGEFYQRASNHLHGNGCRKCGMEKRKLTNLAKYGAVSWASSNAAKTLAENGGGPWSKASRQKAAKTCENRFGSKTWAESAIGRQTAKEFCANEDVRKQMSERAKSEITRRHYEETSLKNCGARHWTQSDAGKQRLHEMFSTDEERLARSQRMLSSDVKEKIQQTSMERYGVPYYWQNEDAKKRLHELLSDRTVQEKIISTKKARGTINSSKAEQRVHQCLVNHFGQNDVECQYNEDERYPFACDFYIKSIDLFIEINASWMHGGHWFDEKNCSDVELLNFWKSKPNPQYKQAVKVWSISDIQKRHFAEKNNLNYLVFWDNDLTDFYVWFQSLKQ